MKTLDRSKLKNCSKCNVLPDFQIHNKPGCASLLHVIKCPECKAYHADPFKIIAIREWNEKQQIIGEKKSHG